MSFHVELYQELFTVLEKCICRFGRMHHSGTPQSMLVTFTYLIQLAVVAVIFIVILRIGANILYILCIF